MIPSISKQIEGLSLQEKILLVEEIWNDIAETTQSLELSKAQKNELDNRLASLEDNPKLGRSWEEVKQNT